MESNQLRPGNQAQGASHDFGSNAGENPDKGSSPMGDAVDDLKSQAMDQAQFAKESVADEVSGVASALRTAADELRRGSPQERTLGQIADGLADASEAIRGKDLGELVHTASDFARRNPAVFLGAAALLGFAATRFAKASSADSASMKHQRTSTSHDSANHRAERDAQTAQRDESHRGQSAAFDSTTRPQTAQGGTHNPGAQT